jgi:hypothetical protein
VYVSPNHPNPPRIPSAPPEDDGRKLFVARRGNDTEFRVSLKEYKGTPFVNLRLWTWSNDDWWPVRDKGITIRAKELRGMIQALTEAADIIEKGPPSQKSAKVGEPHHDSDHPKYVERRRRPDPVDFTKPLPGPPDGEPFNEFEGGRT